MFGHGTETDIVEFLFHTIQPIFQAGWVITGIDYGEEKFGIRPSLILVKGEKKVKSNIDDLHDFLQINVE